MRLPLKDLLCAAATVSVVTLGCRDPADAERACRVNSGAGEAVITMVWRTRPDSMRVLVRHQETVRAACEYVAMGSGPSILAGRIVRGAGVDPRVPFHYLPDSANLVEVAMELCDSALLRTPAEVDAYFLASTGSADSPSAPYCPWSARPVLVQPV